MKKTLFSIIAVCALVLVVSGCNTEREQGGEERAVLKAGQQVSAEMVGWVAVPNTAPATTVDKDKNVTYAVVLTNNVVPRSLNNWIAMNPALFTKMTEIKVETKESPAADRWVMKPEGKSVPRSMHGWVAVPFSQPAIESSSKGKALEMATLYANNIIPKEMNGWVAVEPDALAKISEKYMMTGKGAELPKSRTNQ
jgi:predicted small secreted protein